MTRGYTLSNAAGDTGQGKGVVVPISPTPPEIVPVQQSGFSPILAAILAGAATYAYKRDVKWGAGAAIAAYAGLYYYNQSNTPTTVTVPMVQAIQKPGATPVVSSIKTKYDNQLINPQDL